MKAIRPGEVQRTRGTTPRDKKPRLYQEDALDRVFRDGSLIGARDPKTSAAADNQIHR